MFQYVITGTGPGSLTFTATISGTSTSYTAYNLAFGAWTVAVAAYDAAPTSAEIGYGTASATVGPGVVTCPVAVGPASGSGTLSLTLDWNPSVVPSDATVSGTLTPEASTGTSQKSVSFSAPGTSTYTLNNGYYALALTLLSGSTVLGGAATEVWILNGVTSSGTVSITASGGVILVTISTNLQPPLDVIISGGTKPQSITSMPTQTLTASVTPVPPSVIIYHWYIEAAPFQSSKCCFKGGR